MDPKDLQEDLQSFGFTPSMAKSDNEKGDWETKGPAHKMTEQNESELPRVLNLERESCEHFR